MEQSEIIEGNELIAEFMGGIYKSNLFPIGNTQIWLPFHNMTEINNLKYHNSWDWLMPVVEKIESLGYSTRILDNGMGIEGDLIIERFGVTKIKGTWLTIIEFIKWYNTQEK